MASAIHDMFAAIAHRYDLANDVLSLGMHRLWRRSVARQAAAILSSCSTPPCVLDLCTGTGDLAFALRRRLARSGSLVTGLDFVQAMLDRTAGKCGESNVSFLRGDATAIPFADNSIDLVTVAFGVRNIPALDLCLDEISRVLKSGGTLIVLEFGQVEIPLLRQLYDWYCRVLMPRIGGLLTGSRSAYEYLPQTSLRFPAGRAFLEILRERGWDGLHAEPLLGGLAYIYRASNSAMRGASLGQSAVLG